MNFNSFNDFSGILSIVLGLFAIYQSCKYNRASKRLNEDTTKLMHDRTRRQNEIYVMLREINHKINMINNGRTGIILDKDELLIRKNNSFQESNLHIIIDKINDLYPLVKPTYIESVQAFLNTSEDSEKVISLRTTLNKGQITELSKIANEVSYLGIELIWEPI